MSEMRNTQRAGASWAEIAIEPGGVLAGYAVRSDVGARYIEPLHVTVLVLEDRAGTRAALIGADIIAFHVEFCDTLRKTLAEEFGLDPDCVIFNASHTHYGPQTNRSFDLGSDKPTADEAALEQVAAAVRRAAGRAVYNLRYATVEIGRGSVRLGVNRRRVVDGEMAMAPNPCGYYDTAVEVIKVTGEDARPLAVWFSHGCHPTTQSGINWLGPDYVGPARRYLQAALGTGVAAGFMQGCGGSIRPACLSQEGRFRNGTPVDLDELGGRLADAVLDVCRGELRPVELDLAGTTRTIDLPLGPPASKQELQNAAAGDSEWLAWWGREILKMMERNEVPTAVPYQLQVVRLADGLPIVAMDGEVVSEWRGMVQERLSSDRAIVLGYCGASSGYIPTARMIPEGGYEALHSTRYWLRPGPFSEEIEPVILGAIEEMADAVGG